MLESLEPVYDELLQSAVIAPIGLADDEQQMFVDFELASLAEHRLGDGTDPRHVDADRRADWLARAVHEDSVFLLPKKHKYQSCFWLLDNGQRVGTIAFAPPMGGSSARVYSFYLLPSFRGHGLGSRILTTVLHVLAKHRFSLRLTTDWTWQRTIRFYRKLGFWVYMWKRELDLIWTSKWPPSHVHIGTDEASLSVSFGDSELMLVRARRHGDRLEIEEIPTARLRDKRVGDSYLFGLSTLALELAMEGWPLIRSPEKWDDTHYADGGPPESLAYRITIWEARERARGWLINTPRIPGLEYPTWEEFQARWDKEREEFEAKVQRSSS
jgi:ribosomal protein S18 acetylase RimI-like enzyme